MLRSSPFPRSLLRAAALLACVLCVSCRVSPGGTIIGPQLGAQPWWLVRSAHFVVRSDVGATETRELAVELEKTYRVLLDLGFPMEKDPGFSTDVVVFRKEADYKLVGPRGSAGVYLRKFGRWGFVRPTFLTYGGLSASARPRFVHELTHRFVSFAFPQAPLWFNEGLADYYQTVAIEGDKALLGRNPYRFKRGDSWTSGPSGVPIEALAPVDELMRMDGATFYASREREAGAEGSKEEKAADRRQAANYAGAWALVHVLKNGSPARAAQLDQWLQKMAAGEPAQAAFDAAFAGVSLDQLAAERTAMLERLATRDISVLRTDYQAVGDEPSESRAMRPAEVELLWAWFAYRGGESQKHELANRAHAALEAEPTSVEAHHLVATALQLDGDMLGASVEVEVAARESPDDERAAYALFSFQTQPYPGFERTPAKLAVADATLARWLPRAKSADLLNALAWYMAERGRAEEAVAIARRATKLDPSCAACFDTLAVALFRAGQHKAAIEVEEMAAGLAGEDGSASSFEERVALYRAVHVAVVLWQKRPDPGTDPLELPAAVVAAVNATQRPHVIDCRGYGAWKNPKLAGTVVVRAQIEVDGKVTGAAALPVEEWGTLPQKPTGSPLPDPTVTACVVDQVASTRFPPSSAVTRLTVPFTLGLPAEDE